MHALCTQITLVEGSYQQLEEYASSMSYPGLRTKVRHAAWGSGSCSPNSRHCFLQPPLLSKTAWAQGLLAQEYREQPSVAPLPALANDPCILAIVLLSAVG